MIISQLDTSGRGHTLFFMAGLFFWMQKLAYSGLKIMLTLEQERQKWQIFVLKNKYGDKLPKKPYTFTVILKSSLLIFSGRVFKKKDNFKVFWCQCTTSKCLSRACYPNNNIHGLHIYDSYCIQLEWARCWLYLSVVLCHKLYSLDLQFSAKHSYWFETNGTSYTNQNW